MKQKWLGVNARVIGVDDRSPGTARDPAL